jgi:hypothetical protein
MVVFFQACCIAFPAYSIPLKSPADLQELISAIHVTLNQAQDISQIAKPNNHYLLTQYFELLIWELNQRAERWINIEQFNNAYSLEEASLKSLEQKDIVTFIIHQQTLLDLLLQQLSSVQPPILLNNSTVNNPPPSFPSTLPEIFDLLIAFDENDQKLKK